VPDIYAGFKGVVCRFSLSFALAIIYLSVGSIAASFQGLNERQYLLQSMRDRLLLTQIISIAIFAVASLIAGYYTASWSRSNPIATVLFVGFASTTPLIVIIIKSRLEWFQIVSAALDFPMLLWGASTFARRDKHNEKSQTVT
jgi:hypothetical protein